MPFLRSSFSAEGVGRVECESKDPRARQIDGYACASPAVGCPRTCEPNGSVQRLDLPPIDTTRDENLEERIMNTSVTDEQVRELAGTAKPYSLALLWWGPERYKHDADATEREHQRRMVSLRADGVISILCPVGSDTLAGVAIMNVPPEAASETLDGDPCVQAGMMRCEIYPCHGFPGDALPGGLAR